MSDPADDRMPDDGSTASGEGRLTAHEAATVLGVNERAIRRAIASGRLPATKQAGAYRIASADVARYQVRRQRPVPLPRTSPEPPRLIPFPQRERPTVLGPHRPLTALIGRERELADLDGMLVHQNVRLLTLSGPGGVGKTRLALAAAASAAASFADRVGFVRLASVADPASVASTIARTVGVREAADRPLVERLQTALGPRHYLLVLDNFEHVLAAAPLVAELLTTTGKAWRSFGGSATSGTSSSRSPVWQK